ncbi:MAG TPA: M28 family peptidase, partial [Pirellulales bacterium]|nr:M28 family peptidase [Pirellulales bacterium]
FIGAGNYPIPAYSEFMPPPRLGQKAYSRRVDPLLFDESDPWGWQITEYEQAWELSPGLEHLAEHVLKTMRHLGRRESAHGIAHNKLADNPYWPQSLSDGGAPEHERYVLLMPLALARTQDDKGRVRWTLFGGSEQGPARAFWRGFFTAPRKELPRQTAIDFFSRLLAGAYGEPLVDAVGLRQAGFRIFAPAQPPVPYWREEPLPSWTEQFQWSAKQSLRGVRYLLTFQAFARLPAKVRQAYLSGALHLLPFPGSLVFWGTQQYLSLTDELPTAVQIPLLHLFQRHEAPGGIRVPQSGWMHEPRPGTQLGEHGPFRNTFQRTHRWAKVHRHEDELAVTQHEDKVAHVLFSAAADDIGLYGKPMARNAQVWTREHHLLVDGPHASREQLAQAAQRLEQGGVFGYRFQYPAMRVGRHEVYWHRPLAAYFDAHDGAVVIQDGPLGYLTAYNVAFRSAKGRPFAERKAAIDRPVELWPRLLARGPHRQAIELFAHNHDHHYRVTAINVRKLLDAWELLDQRPLSRSFARQLLTLPKEESLDQWLDALPGRASNAEAGAVLADTLRGCLEASDEDRGQESLTFRHTARRSFEVAYWRTISQLAAGEYINKDNADCVLDHKTQPHLKHHHRDLDQLGDYLLDHYRRLIRRKEMTGKALAGELPFQWQTDFDFNWMGGWLNNQQQVLRERDLLVVIPGRDRKRAVIMADHYDTAYMEDVYGYGHGGHGPRLAAAGADDNHSATAALMLGAPIFMDLSRAGKLACDVWLVHLTGEEFPADCLGARHLCQCLVEGALELQLENGRRRDLSRTRVEGVYVLDMVAHNNDRDRDVFQLCPGTSRESLWLAYQAHVANRTWNELRSKWNQRPDRKHAKRGRRSPDGKTMPGVAPHPHLHGEVRPTIDPRSTLYNTDGQIFSDTGVPVVLFMENYDINRKGYHDTHDTMENIDLDYGAAVAAIAIESVARAASRRGSAYTSRGRE